MNNKIRKLGKIWGIKPLLIAGQAFPGQESKGIRGLCWHLDLKKSRAVCEGICVVARWDQRGRIRHMRERGFNPFMSLTRLSSL